MRRGRRVLFALTLAMLVVVAFSAGFRSAWQTASAAPPRAFAGTHDPTLPLFETWRLIHEQFVDRSAIDDQRLIYGAIRGLVRTLGDPHSSFTDPSQNRLFRQELEGSYDGIGISVAMQNGRLVVVSLLDGSPAAAAGVRTGDVIVAVDGKPIDGLSLTDTILLVRGPRGSPVDLTIDRSGTSSPLEISIVRSEIKTPTVRGELLKGDIAYLKLTGFRQTTADQIHARLKDLLAKRPVGLVLDLRDNPGGYLDAAVDVASEFVDRGPVLYEQDRQGRRQPFQARPGGIATAIPVAVLVNGGSASASEIVAGALQDTHRAILIGEKTYGKGSVQTIRELSDGSGLRVTTAWWLTPSGRRIHGQGLIPDILVQAAAPATSPYDAPLERAISYLLSLDHPPL